MQPSDELQIDSATTGSEFRDNEGSKAIGERRGETGCVKIGMLIAEAVENIDRTRGTWEVAVRSVKSKKDMAHAAAGVLSRKGMDPTQGTVRRTDAALEGGGHFGTRRH